MSAAGLQMGAKSQAFPGRGRSPNPVTRRNCTSATSVEAKPEQWIKITKRTTERHHLRLNFVDGFKDMFDAKICLSALSEAR